VLKTRTKPSRLAACTAEVGQIRQLNRRFLAQPAPLRVLLAATHVLVNLRNALDQRLAVCTQHLDNAALLALVGAGDDFYCVARLDQHDSNCRLAIDEFEKLDELLSPLIRRERTPCSLMSACYTTSFARLTIFMNRRSRSSRATAPKIRVPRGLLSL